MKIKVMNAMMMIISTSVGMGILGLPIATAEGGFLPTLLVFAIAWIFMTLAAFYILDIKMHVRGHASLASMIKLTLGKSGHWFASVIILLLLYALLSTYLMAAVAWIKLLLPSMSHYRDTSLAIGFTFLFVLIMVCKELWLYHVNNVLGMGVLVTFVVMIASSLIPTQSDFVTHMNLSLMLPSFPLLLTTFGFSIVVPAVTEYLQYDRALVKQAILWGSIVSLVAYTIWEWVVFGNIPLIGPHGLQELRRLGDNGTGVIVALATLSHHAYVVFFGKLFAFLLVVTSFLGISLALLHFLGDLLHVPVQGKPRFLLSIAMYVLPVIVVTLFPRAFVQFLSFSGIFVAILLGLFPVWMVYSLKRRKGLSIKNKPYRGWLMIAVNFFFILVILQEVINLMS